MNHLVVHRRAQARRVVVVPLERRLRAKFLDLRLGNALQVHRGRAGLYCLLHRLVHLPQDDATGAHLLNFLRCFDRNRHSATLLTITQLVPQTLQRRDDTCRHSFDGLLSIYNLKPAEATVVLDHRRGKFSELLHALRKNLFRVVWPLHQRLAIHITHARSLLADCV